MTSESRMLWFGVFGAPFAWAVQLLVDYALIAQSCYPHRVPLSAPAFSAARPVAIGVNVLCLLVAIAALVTAVRSLRRPHTPERPDAAPPSEAAAGRVRFMALAGLLVSTLFTFGLVMAALPLLTRSACG